MKNTTIFKGFLVLIIIGLAYLRFGYNQQAVDTPTASPAISSPTPSLSSLQTLETPYFSLQYPLEASATPSVESPDSEEWRVSYMGDTQKESGRTQTELFDGYIVTITKFEVVDASSSAQIQADTDRQGIIDACGDDRVTKIKSDKLGDIDVISYFGGCLGEATNYYFEDGDSLYRISKMVVGSEVDVAKYNLIVDSMLDSFKLSK
jgi:hypothetical protein